MDDVIKVNRKLIEDYFLEVWSKGNLALLDRIIDPAYINHTPSAPNPAPGSEGLKPIIAEMRRGIPDLHYIIEDMVVTLDKVVARVTVKGTHEDTLWGIPPTGKKFEVRQINFEYVRDGKIIAHWRVTEELQMMKQLGVVRQGTC